VHAFLLPASNNITHVIPEIEEKLGRIARTFDRMTRMIDHLAEIAAVNMFFIPSSGVRIRTTSYNDSYDEY
jgi:hypothetical protein